MYFIQLVIQEKSKDDYYRAFLYYKNSHNATEEHELRGYGRTVASCVENVMSKYRSLDK